MYMHFCESLNSTVLFIRNVSFRCLMFSTGVKLGGLDDFITPSQDCIKPVETEIPTTTASRRGIIKVDTDGAYTELSSDGVERVLKKAKITLNDCLACSGCVTTAETILIEQQSHSQLMQIIRNKTNEQIIVVSICPQTVASIASFFRVSMETAAGKICHYLKSIGVDYIFDTSFARNFSLIEIAKEFVSRFSSNAKPPMFTSACPGWICYAEKTHGDFILPHISSVKSPQQIMGSLVKKCFADTLPIKPSSIYHCCVMPCYDKKLEASRSDFIDKTHELHDVDIHDVDCVIATNELFILLSQSDIEFSLLPHSPLDCLSSHILHNDASLYADYALLSHPGSGSGGYLEFVFRYAAKTLFGVEDPEMKFVAKRGSDFQELVLKIDNDVKLKFALAYGFKNLGNSAMKLKKNHLPYDFVEIMACPSGCLNGGGQLRSETGNHKETLSDVTSLYSSLPTVVPREFPGVDNIYDVIKSRYSTDELFHTNYHAVPKMVNPLNIKW